MPETSQEKQISQHERELAERLTAIDAAFTLNEYKFSVGPYHPDIVNHETKTIVEFFGDYTHSNPTLYSSDTWNALCKKSAGEVNISDAKRNVFIESQGWLVLVIWESDWKKSRSETVERVITASNARKCSS